MKESKSQETKLADVAKISLANNHFEAQLTIRKLNYLELFRLQKGVEELVEVVVHEKVS